MDHLSAIQVTLLVTVVGLFGGLVGWFGKGLAFLLTRWWTGSPKQERATYLNTVADLGAKLRANGMTIEDVRSLEAVVQNPSIQNSVSAVQIVEQMADARESQAFQSNYAMKLRTSATLEVAKATLQQTLMEMQLIVGQRREWQAIAQAQEHWEAYRDALMQAAALEYEGGTHAGLAAGLMGVAETERRASEIRAQVEERARL
jgi:uncharacterized protein YecT (DUF1311 family)